MVKIKNLLKKLLPFILLFLIVDLALILMINFTWDSVFQEPVRYAADDGVYHMRLVENMLLGGHFPNQIYFDPFTYFPYGTYIHFAPLYSFLMAGVIWLASFGQPTLELINKIAPFFPPALGGLTVIVIFFIGKILWGKWTGLLSAFLMALSQPFLFRSLLGATDHHQAEILFSSLAILFLILAFRKQGKRKFWLWTILAGIGLGLYFLVWNGALLFLFIIFVFIVLYYLIKYLSGELENRILATGLVIFLITFLMILPFWDHPDIYNAALYNLRHYGSLVLGIIGFSLVWLLGNFIKKAKLNAWLLPLLLAFFGFSLLALLRIVFPQLFLAIIESLQATRIGLVNHELAREIIGEMRPLNIVKAFNGFGYLFYFSFVALGFIIYDFAKKRKPENLLIIIWFLIIILMTGVLIPAVGQGRFVYYLAANVSLLCGFLAVKGIGSAVSGWRISKESPQKNYLRAGSVLLIFNIIFFVFFLYPLNVNSLFPGNLPKIIGDAVQTGISGGITRQDDWYETLEWLRENTPDPGLDYYALYQEPKFNPGTGKIDPYPYPETAYGIMASWDVGHMITYYSHRLPNANPFQQGLGSANEIIEPGETTFFIETDEKKAVEFLDELKTRYIITDYGSANAKGGFYSKQLWATKGKGGYYFEEGENKGIPTEKYYQSMIVKLHYLDGREWQYQEGEESKLSSSPFAVARELEEFDVEHLDHFRLVYESKTAVAPSIFGEETDEKNNIRMIKIFEYVKGAKIRGETPEGTLVEISTRITTNQNREFIYKKSVEAKYGVFEFIVPYSTFGKDGVFASPYEIKIGEIQKIISVSEEEVMRAREINVSF